MESSNFHVKSAKGLSHQRLETNKVLFTAGDLKNFESSLPDAILAPGINKGVVLSVVDEIATIWKKISEENALYLTSQSSENMTYTPGLLAGSTLHASTFEFLEASVEKDTTLLGFKETVLLLMPVQPKEVFDSLASQKRPYEQGKASSDVPSEGPSPQGTAHTDRRLASRPRTESDGNECEPSERDSATNAALGHLEGSSGCDESDGGEDWLRKIFPCFRVNPRSSPQVLSTGPVAIETVLQNEMGTGPHWTAAGTRIPVDSAQGGFRPQAQTSQNKASLSEAMRLLNEMLLGASPAGGFEVELGEANRDGG